MCKRVCRGPYALPPGPVGEHLLVKGAAACGPGAGLVNHIYPSAAVVQPPPAPSSLLQHANLGAPAPPPPQRLHATRHPGLHHSNGTSLVLAPGLPGELPPAVTCALHHFGGLGLDLLQEL